MSDLTKVIHQDFYSDKGTPIYVETVGELVEQLNRLPKDLSLSDGHGTEGGMRIIVYNISLSNPHVVLELEW